MGWGGGRRLSFGGIGEGKEGGMCREKEGEGEREVGEGCGTPYHAASLFLLS